MSPMLPEPRRLDHLVKEELAGSLGLYGELQLSVHGEHSHVDPSPWCHLVTTDPLRKVLQ